jgi:hypothetical protein
MYHFKIDLCPRREPHDWEQCLYAHRGEKARRRHPSKYKPVQCPEARAVSNLRVQVVVRGRKRPHSQWEQRCECKVEGITLAVAAGGV